MHSLPSALRGGGFVLCALFVRESAVARYAVVAPGAPVLKTHHYPNLQLTQIDL
jgi:hypothetical protein